MMKTRLFLVGAAALLLVSRLLMFSAEEKSHILQNVSLRKMADSLHAVIAANQRLEAGLQAEASVNPSRPGHAELLRQANWSIQQHGAEFSYTLRSLEPINASAGPQTEVEQRGLAAVARTPGEPFMTEETLGGRSYFTAVYADVATVPSCIECHNKHPQSPRRNFRVGEVMGGIIVRIPLEF